MSLRINLNTAALSAYRQMQGTDSALGKSIERLSSGFRINSAGDDPAGLVISEKLRAQVSGIGQAIKNAGDAVNMVKTAEGALGEVHRLLRSMRDLALHAANTGANDTASVAADQAQIDNAIDSIDKIAAETMFGGKVLLDGSAAALVFQVGAYAGQTRTVTITSVTSTAIGVVGADTLATTDVSTAANAQTALGIIDQAISDISDLRATLGATQKNVFESSINSLTIAKENIAASESTIRDTDMAAEMVEFTKLQILSQAGTAMLAQANQAPQALLSLLR